MQRTECMCGPEFVFEIINFEWNHVFTFFSEKCSFHKKKLITQKIILIKLSMQFLHKISTRNYFTQIWEND